MRGLFSREAAWLSPTYAMLSLGCVFPFLAYIDAYWLDNDLTGLAALYGTDYLVLLTPALASALLFGVLYRVAARAPHGPRAIAAIAIFAAALITVSATLTLLRALFPSASNGLLGQLHAPFYLGVATLAALGHAFSAPVRRWIDRFFSGLRDFAVIGAVTMLALPLVAWMAGSPAPVKAEPVGGARRDVILITIDTLSAWHMGTYGYARATTPQIDRFAASGWTFDHTYSGANFTTGGMATILTGAYPWQSGTTQLTSRPAGEARAASLPARFQASGYRTVAVTTNPWAAPYHDGLARYYDELELDQWRSPAPHYSDAAARWLPQLSKTRNPFVMNLIDGAIELWRGPASHDPAIATDAAVRRLARRDARPLFLHVHYVPPHDPYAAPPPWGGYFDPRPDAMKAKDSMPLYGFDREGKGAARVALLQARYDEALRWVDASVGRLIAEVDRSHPGAVIIVTADHGESFTGGWGGHGYRRLDPATTRIPLIIRAPGAAPLRIAGDASQIDIMPLALRLASGAPTDPAGWLEARRRAAPVLSMNLADENQRGKVQRGSVAAIEGPWQYTRYLSGREDRKAPFTEWTTTRDLLAGPVPADTVPPEVRARLPKAVNAVVGARIGPAQ